MMSGEQAMQTDTVAATVLVKVERHVVSNRQVQTVNARELHTFLENETRFNDWIDRRIADFGFEEGKDFYSKMSKSLGGRPNKEYALTLDMAKELAMVERNDKGKQARRYFIECERRMRQVALSVTALTKAATPSSVKTTFEAAKLFRPLFQAVRLMGCDKNAAAVSANQAVQTVTGSNLLALLGQTHLTAENQQSRWFTPTKLGQRIGVSGHRFNRLLAEAGLQVKQGDEWTPTPNAQGFYRLFDTGKRQGRGTPVTQTKWAEHVLARVQPRQVSA